MKVLALVAIVITMANWLLALLRKNISHEDMINVYNPYSAIFPVDPNAIASVGDQVLAEHIFAFHGKESLSGGFQSVISNVSLDTVSNRVTIEPLHSIQSASGKQFSLDIIKKSLQKSLSDTRHAPYSRIVQSIESDSQKITISFSKLPVNLKYLFTLPDFSIFDPNDLPVKSEANLSTSGPYSIREVRQDYIELAVNQHYPASLRANAEPVRLWRYRAADVGDLIRDAMPSTHQLMYFFGHSLTDSYVHELEDKGYKISIFPSEWLIYLGFSRSSDLSFRRLVSQVIDDSRSSKDVLGRFGQEAFSLIPSEHSFALPKEEYFLKEPVSANIKKRIKIGTLKSWKDIPSIRQIILKLEHRFPNCEVLYYDSGTYDKMLSELDVAVQMLGLSAADPLSHLSFLIDTDPSIAAILSKEEVADASTLSDISAFSEAIRKIEKRISDNRVLVPVAHFPGVIASSPKFELDRNLSWSWGIQAWTYKIY